jgi:hypothetical protein
MLKNVPTSVRGTFNASLLTCFGLVLAVQNLFVNSEETNRLKFTLNFLASRRGLVEAFLIPIFVALMTGVLVYLNGKIRLTLNSHAISRRVSLFFLIGAYLGLSSAGVFALDFLAF